jgi:hypothetical protein
VGETEGDVVDEFAFLESEQGSVVARGGMADGMASGAGLALLPR